MRHTKLSLLIVVIAILMPTLVACSGQNDKNLNMTPLDQMPEQVKSAPVIVQQAYQFATANPEVMQGIPCYCGCGSIGHTSNYSCYINDSGDFDDHALGCSICVDITQDAMRLLRQGKKVTEVKTYVDANYSKYGTSNMP
jgi:hypothetical protein